MNRSWEEVRAAGFDVAVVTCGYEARAVYVHSQLTGELGKLIVLDYACAATGSYDRNREMLHGCGDACWVDLRADDFGDRFTGLIADARSAGAPGEPLRVLLDVSSCSRSVLATVLLRLAAEPGGVALTCAYALSEWFEPPADELPSSVSEPVIGDLSGWSDDLSNPPCAVIGLGFEPGRALGSIDYLEVPEVRLFVPEGPEPRFREAVVKANEMLLEVNGQRAIRYDVRDPADVYQKLKSLVFGLRTSYRPIVIPLGPKVFAVVAMLLAIELAPLVCVWRTSAGSGEEISDRDASGDIVAFSFAFAAASTHEQGGTRASKRHS